MEPVSKSLFECLLHQITNYSVTSSESIGFNVGSKLVSLLSNKQYVFSSDIDKLRFVCKDVWSSIFGKSINKLQTNHRGTFVLHDYDFQWFKNVSRNRINKIKSEDENVNLNDLIEQDEDSLKPFFAFVKGLVSGILTSLGLDCEISVEIVSDKENYIRFHVQQVSLNSLNSNLAMGVTSSSTENEAREAMRDDGPLDLGYRKTNQGLGIQDTV